MDTPKLQTPTSGRSRFSKALPAPPPAFERLSDGSLRELPPLPLPTQPLEALPFTPLLDSFDTNTKFELKPLDSPLPALPTTPATPRGNMIPRRPVAPPKGPPVVPQELPAEPFLTQAEKKKARRVSSISSLLSAYSGSTTESVQRSSQSSTGTKDSEPSTSPEREDAPEPRFQAQPRSLKSLPSHPRAFKGQQPAVTPTASARTDLPPPPPLKDMSRPKTSGNDRAAPEPSRAGHAASNSGSSLTKGSPPREEIWRRRRASSKTDRPVDVAGLNLPNTNGSTAATTPRHTTKKSRDDSIPTPKLENPSRYKELPQPKSDLALIAAGKMPAKQPTYDQLEQAAMSSWTNMTKLLRSPEESPISPEPPAQQPSFSNFNYTPQQSNSSTGRNRPTDPEPTNAMNARKRDQDLPALPESKPAPPQKDLPTPEYAADDFLKEFSSTVNSPISPAPSPEITVQPSGSVTRRPVGAPRDAARTEKPAPTLAALSAPKDVESSTESQTLQPTRKPVGGARTLMQTMSSGRSPMATPRTASPPRTVSPPRTASPPDAQTPNNLPPRDSSRAAPNQPSQTRPVSPPKPEYGRKEAQMTGPDNGQGAYRRAPPALSRPAEAPREAPRPTTAGGKPNANKWAEAPPAFSDELPDLAMSLPDLAVSLRDPARQNEKKPQPRADSAERMPQSRAESSDRMPRTRGDSSERKPQPRGDSSDSRSVSDRSAKGLELTEAEQQTLDAAVRLFPEGGSYTFNEPEDGIWPAPKLNHNHFSCFSNHASFTRAKNQDYPLACATCGVKDREWRQVCSFCNLRVCFKCRAVLGLHRGNLNTMLEEIEKS